MPLTCLEGDLSWCEHYVRTSAVCSDIERYSGESCTEEIIGQFWAGQSLFATERTVAVIGAESINKKIMQFMVSLPTPDPATQIFMAFSAGKAAKYKPVADHTWVRMTDKPSSYWLDQLCTSASVTLDNAASRILNAVIFDQYSSVAECIEKLGQAYANGTIESLQQYGNFTVQADTFALLNALERNNRIEAMRLTSALIDQKVALPAFVGGAVFAVHRWMTKGKAVRAVRETYEALLELDKLSKSSSIDPAILLQHFVNRALAARGSR